MGFMHAPLQKGFNHCIKFQSNVEEVFDNYSHSVVYLYMAYFAFTLGTYVYRNFSTSTLPY